VKTSSCSTQEAPSTAGNRPDLENSRIQNIPQQHDIANPHREGSAARLVEAHPIHFLKMVFLSTPIASTYERVLHTSDETAK